MVFDALGFIVVIAVGFVILWFALSILAVVLKWIDCRRGIKEAVVLWFMAVWTFQSWEWLVLQGIRRDVVSSTSATLMILGAICAIGGLIHGIEKADHLQEES